jgi:1-phosphofructokinase family hexose kinase
MIRVVGANPALDRISTWPPIRLGEVNRAASVTVAPGGKGFNVARAVIRLGSAAASYGFLGGRVGDALRDQIVAEGVIDRHIEIGAGTRVCFIVVEQDVPRTTVLNEPGPQVSEAETERLLATIAEDVSPSDLLIVAGSLPDSVDPSVVSQVVGIGRAAGARTILDIHGPSLRAGIEAQPWMVKVNRDELLDLADAERSDAANLDYPDARTIPEVAARMVALRARGIDVVVVTLGSDGVLLADASGVFHAAVPQIEVVNPTGSGDLVLAGLAVAIERGQSAREAIALGAACGTAGATHLLPELPPDFDADAWTARISVTPAPGPP